MKQQYKRILLKSLLLLIPFIALLAFYIIDDPFKVLRSYEEFYNTGKPMGIYLNKDYVSTETFLRYHKEQKYDSYIFGDSRSIFYEINDWEKHIDSRKCFHFDASNETLFGVYRKIRLLEKKDISIKNALIVLDRDLLIHTEDSRRHLFKKHPLISGGGWLPFQYEFVKIFFNSKFLLPYLDYKFSGKIKPYMTANRVMSEMPIEYDVLTNEMRFSYYERMIKNDPESYYSSRRSIFIIHSSEIKMNPPVLGRKQRFMLTEIKKIFTKMNTSYRIVVSPLYDQVKFNSHDLAYMQDLFGKDRVFDFSGKNHFTDSMYNYYENSHYRPHVAASVLDSIYRQ